jgi:UDP-N-acetylglucosamine 4,6-dehydratase
MKIGIVGGSGSLGQELTKQLLLKPQVESIRIISSTESKQAEMKRKFNNPKIGYLMCNIRDEYKLHGAFKGLNIIYHCAALKMVDESHDIREIRKTNITGTENVCETAEDMEIEKVIFTSSDKAAYPANVYGKSKAFAEDYIVRLNSKYLNYKTKFACTRYGNCLGSTGSILQIWPEQAKTGTIKITDARMTRFWLSLPQAASFVINCLEGMSGGEIFIPKIKSFSVERLAKLLYPECKIEYIGMRDNGEKLHERLTIPEENPRIRDFKDKYIIGGNHFGGIPLDKDFEYRSDLTESYTDEEMRAMLDGF